MLDQTPSTVKSPHPYTIRLNPTARQYEFWNGRLQAAVPFTSHPAYWLAHRTATKNPHLAAVAWRGAEVVARGRVSLNYLPSAFNRATIANPTSQPYQVAWEYITDLENWEYDANLRPVNPQVRITTCTCEAYQRNLAQYNGHPYCKHIWADQAQRTLESLARAFADIMDALGRISRQPVASTHCRVCGRTFDPGERLDDNGQQCYDLTACSDRKRRQTNDFYRQRSTAWANAGQRRYQQYCNSPLGAQAYVLKALANGATTIRPDKVQAAYADKGSQF